MCFSIPWFSILNIFLFFPFFKGVNFLLSSFNRYETYRTLTTGTNSERKFFCRQVESWVDAWKQESKCKKSSNKQIPLIFCRTEQAQDHFKGKWHWTYHEERVIFKQCLLKYFQQPSITQRQEIQKIPYTSKSDQSLITSSSIIHHQFLFW